MYWYFVQIRPDSIEKLVNYFNRTEKIFAFVPKVEKWFNYKGKKIYIVKEIFSNHLFLKTNLEVVSLEKYLQPFANEIDFFSVIKSDETKVLNQLFNGSDTIKHSVGNIVNSKLVVDKGNLKGLEDYVFKINRHKRTALLKIQLNETMLSVPLEVINKN